jgi:hypothetical protein
MPPYNNIKLDLLDVVIAYRFHHKLLLSNSGNIDCPCKICKLAEDIIYRAKKELTKEGIVLYATLL